MRTTLRFFGVVVLVLLAVTLSHTGADAACSHGMGVYSIYSLIGGCAPGGESGPAVPVFFRFWSKTGAEPTVYRGEFAVQFRGQTDGEAILGRFFAGSTGLLPPGVTMVTEEGCRCQNPSTNLPRVFFSLRWGFGDWSQGTRHGLAWSAVSAAPAAYTRLAVFAPVINAAVGAKPTACWGCTFASEPGPAENAHDGASAEALNVGIMAQETEPRATDLAREWNVDKPYNFDQGIPTWIDVGALCPTGVEANRGDNITSNQVFCFEGAGGDSTWPLGPGTPGSNWDHWTHYDTENTPGVDNWHMTFDPDYQNKGNTCTFSADWMWSAKPSTGPIPTNGFSYVLASPAIRVAGWTGGVVAYSEYMHAPVENNDATNQLIRVKGTGEEWTGWMDPDGVPDIGGGEEWDLNRTMDFSHFLRPGVDSLQVGFEVFDYSGEEDASYGIHANTTYLIDNVSIASFDGTATRYKFAAEEIFSDTFALSDSSHNERRPNADEGTGPLTDAEKLNLFITDPDGLLAGDVRLWWRVGTGIPVTYGSWLNKPLTLGDPLPGSTLGEGTYVGTIGTDDGGVEDQTPASDGRIWAAGETVQYYVKTLDDLANETTLPLQPGVGPQPTLRFHVLPHSRDNGFGEKILIVDDFTRTLLDFQNSTGYEPTGGAGSGSFANPVLDQPENMVERALVLLYGGTEDTATVASPRWDIYNVLGADTPVQREPRGVASTPLDIGGLLTAAGAPVYDAVIWLTGNLTAHTISAEAQTALAGYLDAGGNLIVFGDNVAWNLGAAGLNTGAGFLSTYLGTEFTNAADDGTAALNLNVEGVTATCLDGFLCGVAASCTPTVRRFDRLSLAPPAAGSTNSVIGEYAATGGVDDGRGAIIQNVRTGGGGVGVLAGFDASALVSDACRADLLYHVFTGCFGMAVPSYVPSGGAGLDVPTTTELAYGLGSASPSPFRSGTSIRFAVARDEPVKLNVYNVAGQLVRTLIDERLDAGAHDVRWDGRGDQGGMVASGVYLYRLEAGDFVKTRKVTLLR